MTATTNDRFLALQAVHNFRDLGGYPTLDGRRVRQGRVYRSDGLQRLTDLDLETVRGLGLRSVIDLRTAEELDERGRFPFERHPVHFHHLPVVDLTWDPADTKDERTDVAAVVHEQYLSMLDHGEARVGEALRLLAVPGALPAVFHCAAGKDRTGIVAALLLSALGVDDDAVGDDYGLTRTALERIRRWAEEHSPEMAAAFDDRPAWHLAAEPATVVSLLRGLRERHGSIRAYLHGIGVTEAELRLLDDELLEEG